MPVIAVSCTKGGVGKTTLVICLAEAIARQGGSVAILDADPNGHVSSWYDVVREETTVTVIPDVTEATLHDQIDNVVNTHSIVLIDLEGAASKLVAYAIAASDLTLIPSRNSGMDLQEVFRTYDQVRQAERMVKRPIRVSAVFCQVSGTTIHVQKHAASEMARRGIPVLKASMMYRPAAYAQIHFTGVSPAHPEGNERAREEIYSVVAEVIELLQGAV